MPVKSQVQVQAGLFGAAAAGKATKAAGLSPSKAKEALRGVRIRDLPKRIGIQK